MPAISSSTSEMETASQYAKAKMTTKTAVPSRSSSRKKSSDSREQVQAKRKAANAATRKSNMGRSGTTINQSGQKRTRKSTTKAMKKSDREELLHSRRILIRIFFYLKSSMNL